MQEMQICCDYPIGHEEFITFQKTKKKRQTLNLPSSAYNYLLHSSSSSKRKHKMYMNGLLQ